MNLEEAGREIISLGRSPLLEKLYPIPSDMVPLPDFLAILTRFKRNWTELEHSADAPEAKLISKIFGTSHELGCAKQLYDSGFVERDKSK